MPRSQRVLVSALDGEDRHIPVPCGEKTEIVGIVCGHNTTAESDRRRHNERVDRHLAPGVALREKVTRDPSRPSTRRHDLREASGENCVDRLVDAVTAIQLDKHRRWDSHGGVPPMRAPHRSADALVSLQVLPWTGEGGDGFAVQD